MAPIPDAAYEMCTVFAPDCINRTRQILGQSYPTVRNYGSEIRTTSSTYNDSSSFPGGVFATDRPYYETNYNTANLPRNYGRIYSTIAGLNVPYNRENETLGKEAEEDYEEGSEGGTEEGSVEDNENYNLPYTPTNATFALRPTMETSLQNQSIVSYSLPHLMFRYLQGRVERFCTTNLEMLS